MVKGVVRAVRPIDTYTPNILTPFPQICKRQCPWPQRVAEPSIKLLHCTTHVFIGAVPKIKTTISCSSTDLPLCHPTTLTLDNPHRTVNPRVIRTSPTRTFNRWELKHKRDAESRNEKYGRSKRQMYSTWEWKTCDFYIGVKVYIVFFFWAVTAFGLEGRYERLWGIQNLHLQGRSKDTRNVFHHNTGAPI
jgi:hypothetical protein